MKRLITKILIVTACAAMLLGAVPATNMNTVQAASKAQGTIDLKAKKLTIPKGKTQTIKNKTLTMVKNRRYQVKTKFGTTTVTKAGTYKSSKPAIATVSSAGLVTAKAPGTTTISVTYNGTKQTFKVKVIASHTHSWKTTQKATCATKGKRLCKTCGVISSAAKKTAHIWKTTKKATCETRGTQKCTVCGTTATIAKTSHSWKTETWEGVEGRGTPKLITTVQCNGCNIDMTNWTAAQIEAHQSDLDGILAGTSSFDCFSAGTHGVAGYKEYPQYFMVRETEITCKNCGTWKDKYQVDLYEVVRDGNNGFVKKTANSSSATPTAKAAPKAASNAAEVSVATFSLMSDEMPVEDVVVANENILVANEVIEAEEAVVPTDEVLVEDAENAENAVISGDEGISENNIFVD